MTLQWSRPTERENGQALAEEELAGYRVMYRDPGKLEPSAATLEAVEVDGGETLSLEIDLPKSRWEFVVIAIDTNDLESEPSKTVEIDLAADQFQPENP